MKPIILEIIKLILFILSVFAMLYVLGTIAGHEHKQDAFHYRVSPHESAQ